MGFVSYNAIPPPLAGLFSHPNLDLSNSGLEEYQQPEFEGYEPKTSKNISEDTFNEVRESPDAPMVEKLVSDDNGCSRHMTGNMSCLSDFKEFDGGYVTFGGGAKGGKITVNELLKQNPRKHENSTQDVNTAEPSINTASTNVNTGSLNINTVSPTVTTAPLEATHADFFGDETEVDMSNITTTYLVPSTSSIQDIHKEKSQERKSKHFNITVPKLEPEAMQERLLYNAIRIRSESSFFLYGKIEEEVYVCQPPWFEDPEFPDRVYKIDKTLFIKRVKSDILLVQVYVDDIIFVSTKNMLCTEFEKLMHKKFQMISIGELTFFLGLQVTQKDDGDFLNSSSKYMDEILKKFGFSTVKTASTPMETSKSLLKDENAEDVDVHLYRLMIGSLMYLTSSRPDIIFVVCACTRFQVTPKVSHRHAIKRIFRYLKGQPKLGLWYPKDSPFVLEAYINSDYVGASLDMNSKTRDSEYVAASNCCRQVLWIQNQLLDYGYNFMNTKIFIENESTICIVKNPVFYLKTKHIEIRHHFIRDSNEKKLIQMIKIHTDQNVLDLLTKAFDWIIRKGWLEWNATAAKDEVEVKTSNSKVNAAGHNLVLLDETYEFDHAIIVLSHSNTLNSQTQTQFHHRLLQLSSMADLKFANSHNMVAYLEKSAENVDFDEIVDFLNANPIRYALTVMEGKGSGQPTEPHNTPTTASPSHVEPILTVASSSHPKKTHKHRKAKSNVTKSPQSSEPTNLDVDEAVHEERGDSVERAATTAASLDAEQDSGNINKTQSTAIPNVPFPKGIGSGGRPKHQETIGDKLAQTRFERLSKQSNDPLLSRVNTLRSGEDSMQLNELMEICTKLSEMVLALENIKTAQNLEITNLKKRVKKLEKKKKSRTPQLKRRLFKVRIESSAEKSLETQGRYGHDIEINTASTSITSASINITTAEPITTASAPITTAGVSVSTAEPSTPLITTTIIEDEDLIIAQTLMKMRSEKSKEKSKEKEVSSETATRLTKGVIMKKASETATRPIVPPPQHDSKDKGKVKMDEPKKPSKKKDHIKFDEEDYELCARLHAQEQGELTIKERSKLFVELMDNKKKHFARLRAEEQRRKPPTKNQQRNQMCTYMKNMAGYKHSQLKNKSFDEIQKLFDKEMKRVNTFVPMDSEVVKGSKDKAEGSTKRTRKELNEESVKRQKVEDDTEKAELKACLEIVPSDDSAVNIESLAIKYPIVNWETQILGEELFYYQIKRADGITKHYKIFTAMLDDFDRQDVLDLYRLVKERFETTSLEGYDRFLWGDLITLFKPKKKYPLTQEMLSRMLSGKLEVDHECEMAFELLIFTRSQLKKRIVGIKRHLSVVEVTTASYEVIVASYVSTAGEDCMKYSKSLLLLE
ncbi:putative ribonuclease H-like domain-containing protein [Tanacetum coccineum]